ncbi:MAG: hypothetical protein CMO34_04160 [Verrucomicrobia bacterium]|nr:hypothetical protein [Verrucomicrobiota bacterium]
MEKEARCKNYETPIQWKFCLNCGQKGNLTPITFADIGKDFLAAFANYEAPFPKTFGNLFVRPGKLIREYLAGKRKTYFAPVRYLIICLGISIVMTKIFDFDPVRIQMELDGHDFQKIQYSESIVAGEFMHRNLNWFIFIFPFVIALVTKLFFFKVKFGLAERTTMGFFIGGQYLLLRALIIPIVSLFPPIYRLYLFIALAYLTYAIFSFYRPTLKIWGALKALFAALFTLFLYFFIAFMIALQIVQYFNIREI